jgi:hypothetical protein
VVAALGVLAREDGGACARKRWRGEKAREGGVGSSRVRAWSAGGVQKTQEEHGYAMKKEKGKRCSTC